MKFSLSVHSSTKEIMIDIMIEDNRDSFLKYKSKSYILTSYRVVNCLG